MRLVNEENLDKGIHFNEVFSKRLQKYIGNYFRCYGYLRSYPKKSSIFQYNDTANEVYFVKTGRIRIYNLTHEGKEVTFNIINPDRFLGLAEVFIDSPRVRYAESMCPTTLWVVSKEKLLNDLLSDNKLCFAILWILHQNVLRYQMTVQDLAVLPVRDRIVKLLVRLAKEQGRTEGEYLIIDFPITHEEIAQLVGSSRQTVTTALNEMRKEGIIGWKQKKIIISVKLFDTLL